MAGPGTVPSQGQIPRGVFSLKGAGGSALPKVLANPDVVGLSVRQDWSDLEPNEGEFDFTYLDGQVQAAADNSKVVLLRINTQAHKPAWVTQAVQDANGTFFTFDDNGVPTTIPVFWDSTYLAKKESMISALGKHFASNPTVKIVSASFANAVTEDWNVPHEEDEVLNWIAAGYTTEKLVDAGQQIIDTTMAAFPNQYVTLAIGTNGHSETRQNLDDTATEVVASTISMSRSKWPGRLIVQINSLSTFNPAPPGSDDTPWNALWNSQPDIGAQMLYNVYEDYTYRVNDGVAGDFGEILTASVNSGISYGVNYIEIYEVDVRNLEAVITDARGKLAPTPPNPLAVQFVNISTRLGVGTSDNVLIGGFFVTGNQPKKVIVRAIGPSLPVAGALLDPVLELHDSSGGMIAENDNWKSSPDKQAIIDTGIPPTNDKESAIVAMLTPGSYTAIVHGVNGETGVALVEIYDLDQTVDSKLANISTRGLVQTGDNVMISGLIVLGRESAKTIIRAIGPSLSVPGALADPTLELHDGNGEIIASNDNWRSDQEVDIIASTVPPTNDAEAAIVATLASGSYTAIVRGKDDTTGVTLVEAYQLDN